MEKNEYARRKTLNIAFHAIGRIINELSLSSDIEEKAKDIYIQAYEKKLTSPRGIGVVAAVSILIACRRSKIKIDFNKIAEVSRKTKNEIRLGYEAVASKLFPKEIELGQN